MATSTFYIENNSSYSFWESSYFQSWTYNSGSGVTNGYTTPSNITFDKVFGTSSIPSGSTINSALLYATVTTGTYGGTARHAGSTNYSGLDIKASVTAGVDTSVPYYWKSNTGGSYPATPGIGVTVYSDKTGSAQWSAIRLVVDYTLPYGNVNPPTSLSIATNVAPSTTQRLSWSGATGGTNTTVASYQVFSSADSYATAIGSTSNAYLDVTSSASNGGAITYKVLSVSSPAGYNSSLSTATATVTTTWTAPSVPQNVVVSPASLVSGNATLSWSASSNGTNNVISGYRIDRATAAGGTWSTLVASQTGTSLTVAAHTTKGSSYFYRVEALAPLANSGVSASVQLLTDWSNPTAPTAVSMSATNLAPNTTATLSWSGANNGTNNAIASYDIHVMRQGESTYSFLKSTTGLSTTVTSPAANGTDSYKVMAMGAVSGYNSPLSTATATLATQFTAPSAPSSLTLSYNNVYPSRSVTLSWGASSSGTNNPFLTYQIQRADTVGGTRTVLVASQTATSLAVTAKSTNGSYFYWVIALGTYSNTTSASIELVTTFAAPTVPSNVSTSPSTVGTSGSSTLSWTASTGGTNNALTGYLIERAAASSGPWSTLVASQAAVSLAVTGQAANGSSYYYRVTALAPYANSAASATAQLATSYSPPSTPTGLALSGNDVAPSASVNLTWSASTDGTNNVVSGYQVERSVSSSSGFASISTGISKTNRTLAVTARDAGGQAYYYRVIALAPNGSSAASSSIELRTTVGTISAPTNLRINSATSSTVSPATAVNITWTASANATNNAVTGYKILESSSSGSGYAEIGTAAAGATSYGITTIASEGVRYYKIYATGTYSNSSETGYVSITVSLDTADASTFVMSPAGIDAGTQTTATITASNAAYTHKIWITFGSETSTVGTLAAGVTTWSYTPPLSWLNQIPNSTNGSATVRLETYSGTTLKGVKTSIILIYAPTTVIPTLASFTGTRVNNSVPSAWGLYVVSKSQVDLAMGTGTGTYGSTIVNYRLEGGGMNISGTAPISQRSAVLTSTSTTFTATVTDSRQRSRSYPVVITAIAYTQPSLTVDSYRCVSNGTESDEGTYGHVLATSTFSSISGNNAITLSSKYRIKGSASAYTTISSSMTNAVGITFGSGGLALDKYYEVVYTVTDLVGSTLSVTDEISAAQYLLHFRNNGLGFGVGGPSSEDNAMDVHWKLIAHNGIDLSGTIVNNVTVDTHQDLLYGVMGTNDLYRIRAGGASNAGYLEIATADDGTEPIYVRQYTGVFATLARTLTLLDGSGNTSVPGTLTAAAFSGPLTGNVTGNVSGTAGSAPASDVYSWAKAATKPTYTNTEVGAAANEHAHPGMDLIRPAGTGVQPNNQCLMLSGSVYTSVDIVQAPGLGFHIPGVVWATLKMDSSGDFRFYNSTLSGYQSVRAANFYENDVALSSKYLSLGGGSTSGSIYINPNASTNFFNEGLRLNRAPDGYVALMMGGASGSTADTGVGVWGLFVHPDNTFVIAHNTANGTGGLRMSTAESTLYWKENPVLTSVNYNGYSPSLTGGNASGTWGINITGLAGNSALFNGLDSSRFLFGINGSGSYTASTTQNMYEMPQYKSGFWEALPNSNWTPTNNYYWGATFAHASNSAGYNYSGQIAFNNVGNGDNVYLRVIMGGNPSAWSRIITNGNWSEHITLGSLGAAAAGHGHNDLPILGWGHDINSVELGSGFGFSNAPLWGSSFTFGSGGTYGAQLVTTYYNNPPQMVFRTYYNEGTFTPSSWVTMLHSGNWSSYVQKIIGTGTSLPGSATTGDIFIKY